MRYSIQDIIIGLLKTVILLVLLEVTTSAVLPAIGITEFKPTFNILIVLFFAFKLNTPFLAVLILTIQYIHSAFSIEGWAMGTFVGVLISILVKYVRDKLNFSSIFSTIIVVQIFQIIWFMFVSFMICFKKDIFGNYFEIFLGYIPESIFLSLISHHFFKLLDNFWKVNSRSTGMAL